LLLTACSGREAQKQSVAASSKAHEQKVSTAERPWDSLNYCEKIVAGRANYARSMEELSRKNDKASVLRYKQATSKEGRAFHALSDCIHENSARLSVSTDAAKDIATAVGNICSSFVEDDAQSSVKKSAPEWARDAAEEATQRYLHEEAIATVVQARAAHCHL
jgi:hypothetical protein